MKYILCLVCVAIFAGNYMCAKIAKRFFSGLLPASGSGLEVIKLFSCSTELSMKFFLLMNVKCQNCNI